MAITEAGNEAHWNYLLALDADLVNLSRYIEFSSRNYDCFSIELARILLAAASEADVVCKQLCTKVSSDSKANSINAYRDELRAAFPKIAAFKVSLSRFGLELCPWEAWSRSDGVPLWWTSYNKVKHHRDEHFDGANLKHTLNAVAGLFVIVLYLYREKAAAAQLSPPPQLLHVTGAHHGGVEIGGRGLALAYNVDADEA
jgi:hypothetical protein